MSRTSGFACTLAVALALACSGGSSDRSSPQETSMGVGALGTIAQLDASTRTLVLRQSAPELEPAEGVDSSEVTVDPAVVAPEGGLQVHVGAGAQVSLRGEARAFADLQVGDEVLAVGDLSGATLEAEAVTDLTPAPAASEAAALAQAVRQLEVERSRALGEAAMCAPQPDSYAAADVLEFQGCKGGPSATGTYDTTIPFLCPIAGCFILDSVSYTVAMFGITFDFPFAFTAQAAPVYHVPADVALKVTPLAPTGTAQSYSGGAGAYAELDVNFCGVWGRCYDVVTLKPGVGLVYRSQAAAPLGGSLSATTVSCPKVLGYKGLGVLICQDVGLEGRPFHSTVTATGATLGVSGDQAFLDAGVTTTLRAEASAIELQFDGFGYQPEMTAAFYLRFTFLGKGVNTPSLTLPGTDTFEAVPLGDDFTLPTGYAWPASPVRVALQAEAAPTTLAFTAAGTLAYGTPATVQLTEAYDGSPIAGQPITFVVRDASCAAPEEPALRAAGLDCQDCQGTTLTATTDAEGLASVLLPEGAFQVAATYDGQEPYYLAARADELVTVVCGPVEEPR